MLQSTTSISEMSRSGSSAQLTALYNEAATLCVTDNVYKTKKHDSLQAQNGTISTHQLNCTAKLNYPPSTLSYTNTQREYGPTLKTCTHNYTYTSHSHKKLDKYHTELSQAQKQKYSAPLQYPNTHDTPHRRT
ncbi:hypothetical protein FHG87_016059 [Trinorchestia longiramus]|nr:hypothetical protein FHG87_016059 [Trinorchestia longiramus]